MMLFIGGKKRKVIPLNRLYQVISDYDEVIIYHESGDMVECEGSIVPQLDITRIKFDSADDVDKVMRQFYKACNNRVGAFYFGNEYERKE